MNELRRKLKDQAPWLQQEAEAHLEADNPWDTTVAMGLYLRYRELPRGRKAEIVRGFLEGVADEEFQWPWEWFRAKEASGREKILRLFAQEVSMLLEKMEWLQGTMSTGGSDWGANLVSYLRRVDDAECVAVFLRGYQYEEEVRELCAPLLEQGEAFMGGLPASVLIEDERLCCLAWADCFAWWAGPTGRTLRPIRKINSKE